MSVLYPTTKESEDEQVLGISSDLENIQESFSTIELPIPPEAPVTIMFFFANSLIYLNLLYHYHY